MNTPQERTANTIFGFNLWAWSALTIWAAPVGESLHPVRLCIAMIHFVVGILFLIRDPVIQSGDARSIVSAVPAVLGSGFAFAYAPSCVQWNRISVILFIAGTLIAITAFVSLARNFSVLPAARGVTRGGLYQFLRHPAYAGEWLLLLACFLAKPDAISGLILLGTSGAIVVRIRKEENLLSKNDKLSVDYLAYCDDVPCRLVPLLW